MNYYSQELMATTEGLCCFSTCFQLGSSDLKQRLESQHRLPKITFQQYHRQLLLLGQPQLGCTPWSPVITIYHSGCKLVGVSCFHISLEGFHKCLWGSSRSALASGWLPQNKVVCRELHIPTVVCKADFIWYLRKVSRKVTVGNLV